MAKCLGLFDVICSTAGRRNLRLYGATGFSVYRCIVYDHDNTGICWLFRDQTAGQHRKSLHHYSYFSQPWNSHLCNNQDFEISF